MNQPVNDQIGIFIPFITKEMVQILIQSNPGTGIRVERSQSFQKHRNQLKINLALLQKSSSHQNTYKIRERFLVRLQYLLK